MSTAKPNARAKSSTDYRMTLRCVSTGNELDTFLGSLAAVCEYLGEHCYAQIEGRFDSYHKIRRDLLAAGGAYSQCYNRGAGYTPAVLCILAESLVPARRPETDEERYTRVTPPFVVPAYIEAALPLLPSVAAAIAKLTPSSSPAGTAGNGATWENMSRWQRKNYPHLAPLSAAFSSLPPIE